MNYYILKEILKAPIGLVGGKDNFTTFVGVNFENYPCLKKVKRKLLSAREAGGGGNDLTKIGHAKATAENLQIFNELMGSNH